MNRVLAATALTTAIALAGAMTAAQAAETPKPKAEQTAQKMEHCYGINAVAKNDCSEGAHSCAGQATVARDPKSFVLLPAGDCSKIQGGKLTSS